MVSAVLGTGRLLLGRGAALPDRRWHGCTSPDDHRGAARSAIDHRGAARSAIDHRGAARFAIDHRGAARFAIERMDRLCGLCLWVADEALSQAGGALEPEQVGLCLGSAYGCHANDQEYYEGILAAGGLAGASPRLFTYTLPSSALGEISIHYGLHGPALAIVEGRTSGLGALEEALGLLLHGQARQVLVLAGDVATNLLDELAPQACSLDGAVAILLGTPLTQRDGPVLEVAAAYRAAQPQAALAQAVEQVLRGGGTGAPALCEPALAAWAQRLGLRPVIDEERYPQGSGAVGALHAVSTLLEAAESGLVLAADPLGHAAAVRIIPR